MSLDATRHVWKLRGLSPTQKFVLLRIADRADQQDICWPSPEDLAEDTGFSERAVREALFDLERAGHIHRGRIGNLKAIRFIFLEGGSKNMEAGSMNLERRSIFLEGGSEFKPRPCPEKRQDVPENRNDVPKKRKQVPTKRNDVPRSILEESPIESTKESPIESFAGGSETAPAQQSLIPLGSATPKSDRPRKTKDSSPTPVSQVFSAYCEAYGRRYSMPNGEPIKPAWNGKAGGQLAQLVARLGTEESVELARFYLTHNAARYTGPRHPLGLLLSDYEGLRTDMLSGQRMNAETARRQERTEANPFAQMAADRLREQRKDIIDHE